MAIRKIVYIPNPCLRRMSTPVETLDDALQDLIDDMFETMYDANGVGLAAPQIGINKRLAVIDVTMNRSKQWVLINPEIVERQGEEAMQEGCLSVPGTMDTVIRATHVKLRALDRDYQPYEIDAEGHFAECIQHEVDHLDGKLYLDYLSPLKRKRHEKKVAKFLK